LRIFCIIRPIPEVLYAKGIPDGFVSQQSNPQVYTMTQKSNFSTNCDRSAEFIKIISSLLQRGWKVNFFTFHLVQNGIIFMSD